MYIAIQKIFKTSRNNLFISFHWLVIKIPSIRWPLYSKINLIFWQVPQKMDTSGFGKLHKISMRQSFIKALKISPLKATLKYFWTLSWCLMNAVLPIFIGLTLLMQRNNLFLPLLIAQSASGIKVKKMVHGVFRQEWDSF